MLDLSTQYSWYCFFIGSVGKLPWSTSSWETLLTPLPLSMYHRHDRPQHTTGVLNTLVRFQLTSSTFVSSFGTIQRDNMSTWSDPNVTSRISPSESLIFSANSSSANFSPEVGSPCNNVVTCREGHWFAKCHFPPYLKHDRASFAHLISLVV